MLGRKLAGYLAQPRSHGTQIATCTQEHLQRTLRPGDILLIEGNTRISVAIKYLTQSTWSHATLYIGDALGTHNPGEEPKTLIEADMLNGVSAVPLSKYANSHTRICRPVGVSVQELQKLISHLVSQIGHQYDLKNIFDLARYLIPTPPVPVRWRRRMIAFGSGDPSRAICSTMIAQAFELINYPILPNITLQEYSDDAHLHCDREILHIRHHSLYTPRDFDISPYLEIVKPTLPGDFNYRRLIWAADASERAQSPQTASE